MASIDGYVTAIREAQYGEEVRGSIADALVAMNVETESDTVKANQAVSTANGANTKSDNAVATASQALEAAETAQDSASQSARDAANSATTAARSADEAEWWAHQGKEPVTAIPDSVIRGLWS